jgi:ferredoxin--NADP+ reductase
MSEALRIAVIGSGPSGFFAVDALLRNGDRPLQVDVYDRLPTPYGLVRGGVAPDHQGIKRISAAFARTAERPEVRFAGNVAVGKDVSADELRAHYDAVIYATGNESHRTLGIEGESLKGVHSATEFVFWYNGHPDYADRQFDLSRVKRALIVGVGNVAVDVARILVRDRDELAETDIAGYALDALRDCPIEEVLVVGRRGVAQAAFSPKEIKDLSKLKDVDLTISAEDVAIDAVSAAWLDEASTPETFRKNVDFLSEVAAAGSTGAPRKLRTVFCVSPVAILSENGAVSGVRLGRNRLEAAPGRPRPVSTGEEWDEDVQLVLTSIGYRGIPIAGVPYDERNGRIPNVEGRVHDGSGQRCVGEYVVGWAKRGPSGLIGTNRPDSKATVANLLADFAGQQPKANGSDLLEVIGARGGRVVSFADWQRIDAEELSRGQQAGRVREKFTTVADMLSFLAQ